MDGKYIAGIVVLLVLVAVVLLQRLPKSKDDSRENDASDEDEK